MDPSCHSTWLRALVMPQIASATGPDQRISMGPFSAPTSGPAACPAFNPRQPAEDHWNSSAHSPSGLRVGEASSGKPSQPLFTQRSNIAGVLEISSNTGSALSDFCKRAQGRVRGCEMGGAGREVYARACIVW
jgi:hypothetical protein